jgi:hypothetical protein
MKKNLIILILSKFLTLVVIVCLFSMCMSDNKKGQDPSLSSTEEIITDSILGMIYSVPDPDEILNEILVEDIELNPNLIQSLDLAGELFDSKTIALNMGVYFADMAYLMLMEKNLLAIEYFKTILELSGNLGLTNLQSQDLFSNIENSIYKKDTLFTIIKGSIYDIKDELEYTNRHKILVLIYTGSIVETLYLAVNNVNNNDSHQIREKIIDQVIVVDNLSEFLNQFKDDPEIEEIIDQIDSIKYYMNKSIKGDSDLNVQKDEQNHLTFKSGEKVIYNMDDFESFKSMIFELRNTIIEN